jgi:hypothetical protein
MNSSYIVKSVAGKFVVITLYGQVIASFKTREAALDWVRSH